MSSSTYHHGDLRAACVRAAIELLEEDGTPAGLSLRAVARRAGVSPGAPYRHYEDRDALVSAVAAVGYRELADSMAAPNPSPSTPEDLAELGLAYVEFALRRPALFRLMFGEPCERENNERVAATAAIWELVSGAARACFPGADVEALSNALWSLVHGLAFLHLDGKFDATSADAVSDRVRAAIRGIATASFAESAR
ncbi:TetR/AcrR family transcriptional regulator [Mycobacterium asiaticum]|uniref:TetR family transcriptional regulator n=1 Tax=Mycobacterium asiaticum TaxID=1790 RepID=A0A1A3CLQ5_MYCAS|nr:TetR/AcrR family transcriptional regulator [Mycobacterium asiaticum]OBI87909.1 TetR family transcriptional regulator [Mycobacterium asiaticum]